MTTGSNPIPTNPQNIPLRGTQSLVGVMAFVWKHPSLTALELLWRWLAAVPMLWLAYRTLAPALTTIPLDTAALQSMTFFEPVRSTAVLAHQIQFYLPALERTGRWWIPLTILVWAVLAGLGRTTVLRRANKLWVPQVPQRIGFGQQTTPYSGRNVPSFILFSLLRTLAFLTLLALWTLGLLAAIRFTVTYPSQHGGEPNLVLLTAEAVALTLAAFLLWSLTVWVLDLKPLQTFTQTAPEAAEQRAHLRAKLIETNLVMGIVRVILLVLALTFSASPLPFQSQETQAFINVWWTGVAVFYILSSDFFHVVRRVTYLRLLQTIARGTNVPARVAS